MRRIVLDCSNPEKGCEDCIFNTHDGCRAPVGLRDCYVELGVWKIEEVEEGGRETPERNGVKKCIR